MDAVNHKQPHGFLVFFLTEMWERYGFYIIQTVLVFYLLDKLHLDDSKSYVIVGSFTALAYINSFFGGLIADRFIGSTSAIFLGGVFLFIGYMILGLLANLTGLSLGLGMVSVGTGLLKPNISSLLSTIYPHNDDRKEAGYTLYYVGIYVGALGGSLLGGYIAHSLGWMAAFTSSAIGIVIGLVIFLHGRAKYKIVDKRKTHLIAADYVSAVISIGLLFIVSALVLHSEFLSTLYFIFIAIFCFGFILFTIITHHGMERKRLIAFLFLVLLAVCYWAIFYQQFFSMSLCTSRVCMLPDSVPASSMPSIESLGVILIGPLINYVWFYYKDSGREISIATKFSLSFLFNSLCFLLITAGLWYSMISGTYLSAWFIVLAYVIMAIGELCLSPTSLSMVSSLVPPRYGSSMMGISLLSIGFGGKLAGLLASSAAINNVKSETVNAMQSVYLHSFIGYLIISIATFIISLILGKYINNLITKH
jgi:proton-dependent oligopeptide transporter, POT family